MGTAGRRRRRPSPDDEPSAVASRQPPDNWACLSATTAARCGADAAEGEACGRCGATLHSRKPDSLSRTWALLVTACILYVPANLMPVMTTRSLFGTQEDTILSGVIYFWVSGDWALAAIIFIASFLVPLFKLGALMLMALAARRHSEWARPERTRLYRVVEVIGRWSMLDVFVVSLLAGLVRMDNVAEITAGPGIAAFGGVVVLTMLASISFDPRLGWDDERNGSLATHAPRSHRREPSMADDRSPVHCPSRSWSKRRRWLPSLIWLIPIVAALVGVDAGRQTSQGSRAHDHDLVQDRRGHRGRQDPPQVQGGGDRQCPEREAGRGPLRA